MTSSNGNIFRITDPLSGESIDHRLIQRWILLTMASDTELWFFSLMRAKTNGYTNEPLIVWDVIVTSQ